MLKQWFQSQVTKVKKVVTSTWKKWMGGTSEIYLVIILATIGINTLWFLLYFAAFNRFYNYFNGLLRWFIVVVIVELITLLWERWKVYDQYVAWYRRVKAAQDRSNSGESDDK